MAPLPPAPEAGISGWGWPFPPGGPHPSDSLTLAGRRNSWASGSPASWTLAKEPKVPARRYLERLLTFPGTGIWGGKAPAGLSRDRLRCAGRTFLQRPVSCAKGRWRPRLFPGSQELCEPGGNDRHHLTAPPSTPPGRGLRAMALGREWQEPPGGQRAPPRVQPCWVPLSLLNFFSSNSFTEAHFHTLSPAASFQA